MRQVVVMLIVVLGCSGGAKSQKSAEASPRDSGGGSSQSSHAAAGGGSASAAGVPEWVTRGTVALNANGQRRFYGVAAASGIKNGALLRSTADNRARNDLAKIFEVFSASLMKDYSASTGEQSVEQAVKTMTSSALEGVEIVDRYIDGDGSMYALAMLDLDKGLAAVKKAKELGAVKSHVEKVSVDDIFDAHAKKPAPPPPVVATTSSGDTGSAKPAPKEATSGAKQKKGGKPAWVDGTDPSYPAEKFLCAVGYAKERSAAENASYAGLSKIFIVSVESVAKDFMGAYASTGAQAVETQSSEQTTQVSTAKVLSGVQVYELWDDKGTIYGLACLDRPRTAASLREQIEEADGKIKKALEKAEAADKAKKVTELSKAMDSMVVREVLNGELRIVEPSGIGVSGEYSHADVASAFEEAVEQLRVGVTATGSNADELRRALTEGLVSRGWSVLDLGEDPDESDDSEPLDVEVSATIRMENAGAGTGDAKQISFVRAVIDVTLKNVAKSKVMASFSESRREGHRSLPEAQRRAVREMSKILITKVGAEVDKAMKGKK
jgi:hypothetical protein